MLEFQKAQMTEIAQKPRPSKNAFCKFASGSKSPPPRKKKNGNAGVAWAGLLM